MSDTPFEPKEAPEALPSEGDVVTQSEHEVEDALSRLQQDLGAVQDKYVRLAAEFENYKKREQRERESLLKYANERLLTDMLPVLDSLDQAVGAGSLGNSEDPMLKNLITGIKMVQKSFIDALERFGVQQFTALGKQFDPNLHEALQTVEDSAVPEGQVVQEFQKGYLLNGRLVRAARVVIAKNP